MRTVYVKLDILAVACTDEDEEISMIARGTVEIPPETGKKTKWNAKFSTKWVITLEKELEKKDEIVKEIANTLGRINVPFTRTFTYDISVLA